MMAKERIKRWPKRKRFKLVDPDRGVVGEADQGITVTPFAGRPGDLSKMKKKDLDALAEDVKPLDTVEIKNDDQAD